MYSYYKICLYVTTNHVVPEWHNVAIYKSSKQPEAVLNEINHTSESLLTGIFVILNLGTKVTHLTLGLIHTYPSQVSDKTAGTTHAFSKYRVNYAQEFVNIYRGQNRAVIVRNRGTSFKILAVPQCRHRLRAIQAPFVRTIIWLTSYYTDVCFVQRSLRIAARILNRKNTCSYSYYKYIRFSVAFGM